MHAQRRFEVLAERTDLHVMHMRYFGKGFIKKCQMSPDAFVQVELLKSLNSALRDACVQVEP